MQEWLTYAAGPKNNKSFLFLELRIMEKSLTPSRKIKKKKNKNLNQNINIL